MPTTQHTITDEVRKTLASTNELFNTEVFGKRNLDALDQIYTTNARILPPSVPLISGRNEIKKFWQNLIQSVNAKSAVLKTLELLPAGDNIVEIGYAALTLEPGGQPAQMEIKYVVYWQQEDGQWKWHVDIWNQNAE